MAPLLLLALVIGFYWKVTLTRQYDWGWGPDFATQVLPWFHVQARQWHVGEFPLWDPYLWGGQPLLGQAQPGGAYPLNWILFLLPLDQSGAIKPGFLQAYFVVIHYMAALFCYWLSRDLGRSRAASIFAGMAFSVTGFLGTKNWPQMINGCVWAPLVLLFVLRALRPGPAIANAALAGAALGMAWLSGHHQIPLFISLAVAGIWAWECARDWRKVRLAACCFVFAGLMGALQILPAREYGKGAKRWAGVAEGLEWNRAVPYPVHEQYSLTPKLITGLATTAPEQTVDPYMGIAFVTLAVLGITFAWKQPGVAMFASLAGAAWIYALGGYTLAQGLFYVFVPIVEKARTPAAALHLFHLAAAVLAAFGLDSLPKAPQHGKALRRATIVLVAFGAILAVDVQYLGPADLDPRYGLAMLTAWLTATFLRWRHAPAALIAILLVEANANTGALIAPRSDKGRTEWMDRMRDNRDIAAFLKSQPGPFRAIVIDKVFEENWGAWHGIEMRNGYLASMTTNMADWPNSDNANRVFNVRYAIGRAPSGFHREPVFQGASGLRVFADPEAFPRAWVVHRAEKLANLDALHKAMDERPGAFRDTAFFLSAESPTVAGCEGKSTVETRIERAGAIRLRADMACAGLVVVAMTHAPGWTATTGGRAVPVVEANGLMPAIALPAGRHEVELKYRPRSVPAGAILTLSGLLAAAILAWRSLQLAA